jgi:hypothetical protein
MSVAESSARKLTASAILSLLVLCGCPEEDLTPYLDQGACKSSFDCVKGYHCQDGACIKDGTDSGGGPDECGCFAPESCCNQVCVNLKTDPNNCKTCGTACKHTQCINGDCTVECVEGFLDCNNNVISDGCEVEGSECPDSG